MKARGRFSAEDPKYKEPGQVQRQRWNMKARGRFSAEDPKYKEPGQVQLQRPEI